MGVFEHSRVRIMSPLQHPYGHNLSEMPYSHVSTPITHVSNHKEALDWILSIVSPFGDDPVDTKAELLALTGMELNDFKIVNVDESQGNYVTGYRWMQDAGEETPSWHLVYKLNIGIDSIISGVVAEIGDDFVVKLGNNDADGSDIPYTGDLLGQHIYGGTTTLGNLTLFPNSFDSTGFIQFGNDVRPLLDSTYDLGTATKRFFELNTIQANIGSLEFTDSVIDSATSAISFVDNNLSTTGWLAVSSLTLAGGSITDSSGTITFADENLITTGNITGNQLYSTTGAVLGTGTTVGTLTLGNGSIIDSSGAISFGNENLSTTGEITCDRLKLGKIEIYDSTIENYAEQFIILNTFKVVCSMDFEVADGISYLAETYFTGRIGTEYGRDLEIYSDSGHVVFFSDIWGGNQDIGASFVPWKDLYLSGSIGNGSTSITVANLGLFGNVGTKVNDDVLTWDSTAGLWKSKALTAFEHGNFAGLDDDDHSQYVLGVGRSGGQTIVGSTVTAQNLILKSNSVDVATGYVVTHSNVVPNATDVINLGTDALQFNDIYSTGVHHGLRLENVAFADLPSPSASSVGRVFWVSDLENILVDRGGQYVKISVDRYSVEHTWSGSEKSKLFTVDGTSTPINGSVDDARLCLWHLYDMSSDYERIDCEFEKTQTTVRVVTEYNLTAGLYLLVGIG